MNEAISKILNHLQREQDDAMPALLERLDSYTSLDGFVFDALTREQTREIREWIHNRPRIEGVETFVYTYRGRIHLEFDYEVFDLAPADRLRCFEQAIARLRQLARRFPDLCSEWTSCIYGLRHAYYRIKAGQLLLAEPVTSPDEARVRMLS